MMWMWYGFSNVAGDPLSYCTSFHSMIRQQSNYKHTVYPADMIRGVVVESLTKLMPGSSSGGRIGYNR